MRRVRLFDYDKVSRLMEEAGVDVLLASSRPNVSYLSDYWYEYADAYYLMWDPRASHVVLAGIPRDQAKEPFLILPKFEMGFVAAADPWIRDRRPWGPGYYIQQWDEPHPDPGNPIDEAAQALRERRMEDACIAVEKRYLGVGYFQRLKELLPRATFVDAESILWKLRMVKSPQEVQRIRAVCRRTAQAWEQVIRSAREGMTERELEWAFVQAFADQRIEYKGAYYVFGPAGVSLRFGAGMPSENTLREGQFIRTDIVGRYLGYYSDISRVVAFGKVSPHMERAHAIVRGMLERLTALIKPGMTCAQVRRAELAMYAETEYKAVVPYTGHSVGRQVHEPPYLTEQDETVLEPGMVLAIEPTITFQCGGDINVCLEDDLLVTEERCECLTTSASLDLYL